MAARLLMMAAEEDALETARSRQNVTSLEDLRGGGEQHSARRAEAKGRLAECIHRCRSRRDRYFPKTLFGEPAWDLLLELYFRKCNDERVTVSNACVASGVPQSTALRWIDILIDMGLAVREADVEDRRKIWLVMTEYGWKQMQHYLADSLVRQCEDELFSV